MEEADEYVAALAFGRESTEISDLELKRRKEYIDNLEKVGKTAKALRETVQPRFREVRRLGDYKLSALVEAFVKGMENRERSVAFEMTKAKEDLEDIQRERSRSGIATMRARRKRMKARTKPGTQAAPILLRNLKKYV